MLSRLILICAAIMCCCSLCGCQITITAIRKYNVESEKSAVEKKVVRPAVKAINRNNSRKLYKAFSEQAISECASVENIKLSDECDDLIDKFDSRIKEYKYHEEKITTETNKNGNKVNQYIAWYNITTKENKYVFLIVGSLQDEENSCNKGIYSITVYSVDDYENFEYEYDETQIKPGITYI